MKIGNCASIEEFEAQLREMESGLLTGQELVQKGAIHALERLKRMGVTRANLDAILAGANLCASAISAESRRRGLPIVDHPGGN